MEGDKCNRNVRVIPKQLMEQLYVEKQECSGGRVFSV